MKTIQKIAFILAGFVVGHIGFSVASMSESSPSFEEQVSRKTMNVARAAHTVFVAQSTADGDNKAAFSPVYPSVVPDAGLYSSCIVNIQCPNTAVVGGPTPVGGGTYGISFIIENSVDNGTAWYTLGTPILLAAGATVDSTYVLTNFGNQVRVKYAITASAVPDGTATYTVRRDGVIIKYLAVR